MGGLGGSVGRWGLLGRARVRPVWGGCGGGVGRCGGGEKEAFSWLASRAGAAGGRRVASEG